MQARVSDGVLRSARLVGLMVAVGTLVVGGLVALGAPPGSSTAGSVTPPLLGRTSSAGLEWASSASPTPLPGPSSPPPSVVRTTPPRPPSWRVVTVGLDRQDAPAGLRRGLAVEARAVPPWHHREGVPEPGTLLARGTVVAVEWDTFDVRVGLRVSAAQAPGLLSAAADGAVGLVVLGGS